MKRIHKLIAALTIMLAGCDAADAPSETSLVVIPLSETTTVFSEPAETAAEETETESETEPVKSVKSVTFTALGDNLIHSSIYKQAARRSSDGGYDFSRAYEGTADLLDDADITVINQETLICNDRYEPSSYPRFNSPNALGDYMRELGVDVFTIANNHTMDMGEQGLISCLDYYDENDMVRVGAYRDADDRADIRVVETEDAVVSFLCYTESLNGLELPAGSSVEIGRFDMDTIKKEIAKAKGISDICFVSLHWGTENSDAVEDYQRRCARELAEAGADVIIGNHPHVLREIEVIERPDGSQTLCAYSLGNFISAQNKGKNLIGGVLDFTVNVDEGRTEISDTEFIPVITHFDGYYSDIRQIRLSDYPRELADSHGVKSMSAFGYDYIIDYLKSKGLYEYIKE